MEHLIFLKEKGMRFMRAVFCSKKLNGDYENTANPHTLELSALKFSKYLYQSQWARTFYAMPKSGNALYMAKVFYPTIEPEKEDSLEPVPHPEVSWPHHAKGILDSYKEEAKIHSECSVGCTFIVRYLASWRLETECVLLMELCPLRNLKNVTKRERTLGDLLLAMIYCILSGLAHMNSLGYFHGDIKPSNLLLSEDGVVKLCDFGTAQNAKDSDQTVPVVKFGYYTEGFKAPEVLEAGKCYKKGEIVFDDIRVGSEAYAQIMMKRDIYALAVTIFVLYCGPIKPRPSDLDPNEEELYEIFDDCAIRNPKERPSASELLRYKGMRVMEKGRKYMTVIKNYIEQLSKQPEDCRRDIRRKPFEDTFDLWN